MCCYNAHGQITVSADQTAQALAERLAGQGVTITNAALTCPKQANGFFRITNSSLLPDSGIVLTTGRVATQGINYGVNGFSIYLASNDNNVAGDVELNTLAGQATIDACKLEFDVVPNGDTIKFDYVFSSEEYMNAVCGPYNDAFAFFISGPGIAGSENMALVPGTNIPVTINSINNGVPGSAGNIIHCTEMGTGAPFTAYYTDNSSGSVLTHKGLTQALQAVHAVNHCSVYHLKLVIADAGDPLYDSAVFLRAGSLQTVSYHVSAIGPVHTDTSSVYCIKGCLPGRFEIRRSIIKTQPETIKFVAGGSAVSGIDYSAFADSVVIPANDSAAELIVNGLPTPANGVKTVKIFILSPNPCTNANNIIDSASIAIYDTLHISIATPDTVVCGNDSVQLRVNGPDILTYSWQPAQDVNDANSKNPVAIAKATTRYTVTASMPGSSCPIESASLALAVRATPEILMAADTTVCFNTVFPLNAVTGENDLYYSYLWTGPAGFTSTMPDQTIDAHDAKVAGLYTLKVTNDTNGCASSASVKVMVNTPQAPRVVSPVILCQNRESKELSAVGDSILWYNAAGGDSSPSAPFPSTKELAVYDYYATQIVGNCESPKAEIEVEVKKCCDGTIFIPTAFTPNGDGRNDRFEPVEDYGYFIYRMSVYNRWGQAVFSGTSGGWDGNFGGNRADPGTYFYFIKFGCILGGTEERKGEVLLIR